MCDFRLPRIHYIHGQQLSLQAAVAEPRRAAHADFYRNHDPLRDSEMKKAGVSERKVVLERREFAGVGLHGSLSLTCAS